MIDTVLSMTWKCNHWAIQKIQNCSIKGVLSSARAIRLMMCILILFCLINKRPNMKDYQRKRTVLSYSSKIIANLQILRLIKSHVMPWKDCMRTFAFRMESMRKNFSPGWSSRDMIYRSSRRNRHWLPERSQTQIRWLRGLLLFYSRSNTSMSWMSSRLRITSKFTRIVIMKPWVKRKSKLPSKE